jgi:hypothetical protein
MSMRAGSSTDPAALAAQYTALLDAMAKEMTAKFSKQMQEMLEKMQLMQSTGATLQGHAVAPQASDPKVHAVAAAAGAGAGQLRVNPNGAPAAAAAAKTGSEADKKQAAQGVVSVIRTADYLSKNVNGDLFHDFCHDIQSSGRPAKLQEKRKWAENTLMRCAVGSYLCYTINDTERYQLLARIPSGIIGCTFKIHSSGIHCEFGDRDSPDDTLKGVCIGGIDTINRVLFKGQALCPVLSSVHLEKAIKMTLMDTKYRAGCGPVFPLLKKQPFHPLSAQPNQQNYFHTLESFAFEISNLNFKIHANQWAQNLLMHCPVGSYLCFQSSPNEFCLSINEYAHISAYTLKLRSEDERQEVGLGISNNSNTDFTYYSSMDALIKQGLKDKALFPIISSICKQEAIAQAYEAERRAQELDVETA